MSFVVGEFRTPAKHNHPLINETASLATNRVGFISALPVRLFPSSTIKGPLISDILAFQPPNSFPFSRLGQGRKEQLSWQEKA